MLNQPGPVLLGLASIGRNGGFRSDNLKTYGGECPEKLLVRPGDLFASLKDVTQSAELLGSVARLPLHAPVGRLTQDTVRLDFVSDGVDPAYLFLSLLTPEYRQYCRGHATGTTNLGLPRKDFLAYRVLLPPLAHQRRIAEVLGALDDLNDNSRALARNLWSAAAAAFVNASARAEVVPAGECIELRYGKALPTPSRRLGPVAVVSSAGVVGSHDQALVRGPGVVVGRKGSVGTVTWVDRDFFPIDTAFYVESTLPMPYCYFALLSMGLERMNTDSAVPGLNRSNALSRPFPRPTEQAVDRFVAVAAPLLAAAKSLEDEADGLVRTRDELLPLLLAGRVRVSADSGHSPGRGSGSLSSSMS